MNFIENFKKYLLSLKKKPSFVTIKNYLSDVKKFINWYEATFKKIFTPSEISLIEIKSFEAESLTKLSAVSVKRILSSLRSFFSFLQETKQIAKSPFEIIKIEEKDPFLLHEFKNSLFMFNSSHLTIKNYTIDVKQFLNWLEKTIPAEDLKATDLANLISTENINEYKNRLIFENAFSKASINRKLSSLKKYFLFIQDQPISNLAGNLNEDKKITAQENLAINNTTNQNISTNFFSENDLNSFKNKGFSRIPPLRLMQKTSAVMSFLFEKLFITPVSELIKRGDYNLWKIRGRKIFTNNIPVKNSFGRSEETFSHLPKSLYAPLKISITNFTPLQKLIYHLKYTRPLWYKKYHQTALAHYFNLAILFIFSSAIGISVYTAFGQSARKTPLFASAPSAPLRILSFQGRLTDNSDNPITAQHQVRFIIYNDPNASSSARLWEELDTVSPDSNGIFSILLGSNGSGGNATLCNGGNPSASPATTACGIPQSLFANNPTLYLGVTIENTTELTPRQQLATVPYATNAEVLQGLAPTTDSTVAGNANVVLALNSSGTLNIQGTATTTFQNTGGQFVLSGKTLTLNTASGSNSNVQVAPDGTGFIDLQKPIINSTKNNNIPTALGAVEIDSLLAVLATSSGQSAFTLNQNGAGPVISASHSGTAIFTLDSSGNGTFAGNTTALTGNLTTLNVSNNVSSNLNPSISDNYNLGSSAGNEWLNLYAKNIYSNGQVLSQFWQLNFGALSPLNITNDLLLGGTGTTSATTRFGFLNVASGTPVASISANSGNNATYLTGDGTLATTNRGNLTLGNSSTYNTTENVLINPNGTGNVGIGTTSPTAPLQINGAYGSNAALIVNQLNSGDILAASSSGATKFTIQNSGAIKDANYTTAGGILFADNAGLFTQTTTGLTGQCLVSNGGTAPTWTSCSGTSGNYWTLSSPISGALVPINNTLDLLIGGNATSSAKFGFLNVASGTPTASISAGVNGATFLTASGNLQTTASQTITLGGGNSGNITLTPLNTTNGITFSGYTTGIIHSASGALSSSAVNLASADVTNTLGVGNGGTGNSSLASGALFYGAGGTANLNPLAIGANNSVLISNGTAPSWTTSPTFDGNLTVNGNTTLGASSANTLTINAGLNQTLLPATNGNINLGSNSFYFGTVYADNIIAPVGSGTSGFWSLATNTLYPVSTNYDLLIGGTATGSATPFQIFSNTVGIDTAGTATTSGNLSFRGANTTINSLNGGNLNFQTSAGGDGGLTSAFYVANNGSIGIGNITPTSFKLQVAGSIGPNASNTYDLGSSSNIFANVYGSQFKQGASHLNVLDTSNVSGTTNYIPLFTNTNNIGNSNIYQNGSNIGIGNLTASYLLDVATIGNSTTANLGKVLISDDFWVQSSSPSALAIFNNQGSGDILTASSSGVTKFNIDTNGNLIASGNLALNGGSLTTNQTTASLFNSTATTLNIGGAGATISLGAGTGTTTVNNALTATGTFTGNGNIVLGATNVNTITVNGYFNSNLIPNVADTYNLGSASNEWNNLYVKQIISPVGGGIAGYWQLNSNVLSPSNNWNDLVIGGTATGSATPFQIFANTVNTQPAGTASTSGNLSFRGANSKINLLNGATLGIYSSVGGDGGLSANPALYVANNGNVGIGTANPKASKFLTVSDQPTPQTQAGSNGILVDLGGGGGIYMTQHNSVQGKYEAYNNVLGIGTMNAYPLTFWTNNAEVARFDTSGFLGIGTTSPQGILDVKSSSLPSDLMLNQVSATNLTPNPSFEGGTQGWTLSAHLTQSTDKSVFGSHSLKFTNNAGTTENTTSSCIAVNASTAYTFSGYLYLVSGLTGSINISLNEFSNSNCSTQVVTGTTQTTATTNSWTRVNLTQTTGSTTVAAEIIIGANNANGTAYIDGLQLETGWSVTPYLDGSLGSGYYWTGTPNNSSSVRRSGSAFAYQTINSANGIGASSTSNFPTLQLDQNGTGNIITASASGTTEFRLTNSGSVIARSFYDLDNQSYFLDPAATGIGLRLAGNASSSGSLTFDGLTSIPVINYLNNSNLNFQRSVGGDAGLTSTMYLANNGNVGIGTTSPDSAITVGVANGSEGRIDFNNPTTDATHISWSLSKRNDNNQFWLYGYDGTTFWNPIKADYTNKNLDLVPDGTGNVGIGTTSPGEELTVVNNGGTNAINSYFQDSGSSRELFFVPDLGTSGYNNSSLAGDSGLFADGGGALVLGTHSSSYGIRIQTNGNVGIGTTGPNAKTEISAGANDILKLTSTFGGGGNMDSIAFNTYSGTGVGARIAGVDNGNFGANIVFQTNNAGVANSTSTSTAMEILSNGNVGINTTTPNNDALVINGVGAGFGYSQLRMIDGNYGTMLRNDGWSTYILLTNSGDQYGQWNGYRPWAVNNSTGDISMNGTTIVQSSQFELVRGAASAGRALEVNGAVGASAFINNSDARWKKNISDIPDALKKVMNLKGVYFYWNKNTYPDNTAPDTRQIGFIAQDVNSVAPELATQGTNGYWGVDYGRVSALLVDAIQEQQTQIASNTASLANFGISTTGDLAINPNYSGVTGGYNVKKADETIITQLAALAELFVGHINAGFIETQQLSTNSFAIATDNITIASQSLRDYIINVVRNSNLVNNQTQIISPIAQVDQIHTNIISPLGNNLTIKLASSSALIPNSKFIIQNSTGSAVASIDNVGNATFSGTLNSGNLAVNTDATISGTLYANKIKANSIEGLSAVVSTLSAQNITNVTNIYMATPSANTVSTNSGQLANLPSASNSGVLNGYTNIASYSGVLTNVLNLHALTAQFDQGIIALGPTSLSDTTINGQLAINSNFIISGDSLNVLGADLSLQPLRQGGINFEGGLLAIDTSGNLTIGGNEIVKGTLLTNIISPLPNHNLNIDLSNAPISSSSSSPIYNSSFIIHNSTGSAVLAINQNGDLTASGNATFNKLNLNLVQPALAVSDTEAVATGSAGTTQVNSYQKEITIDDPLVNANSLIYVTPIGTPSGETPFLLRQAPNKSFTVGVSNYNNPSPTQFNWLIVN